jgi:hypothetical protein
VNSSSANSRPDFGSVESLILKNRVISSFIFESTITGAGGQMFSLDAILCQYVDTEQEEDTRVTLEINR